MSGALLSTEGLSIGYTGSRGRTVSSNVNIEMAEGEVVSVVGPNGSGKSTLLKTLCGILSPLEGKILLEGSHLHQFDARSRAREVAVVLAGRVETGHLSVEKLVALGRYPYTGRLGKMRMQDEEAISWALASVGGQELRDRYVDELSDGEYQRIMIARALAQQPRIVFLDEPAAFLDVMKRVEIMHLLKKISRESSASFIVASHDLEMVMSVSDRIWLMSGQGELHDGAPEDHVLDGTLARVFHSSHVSFDSYSGTFRHVSETHKPVVGFVVEKNENEEKHGKDEKRIGAPDHAAEVDTEKIEQARRWTCRALERMGFTVLHGEEPSQNPEADKVSPEIGIVLGIINNNTAASSGAGRFLWKIVGRNGNAKEHFSIASMAQDIRNKFHYME